MPPIYDQPDERPNFFRERPDLFDREKRRRISMDQPE
jgi:hypothetical protein